MERACFDCGFKFPSTPILFSTTQVDMGAWESCEEMPAVSLACKNQVGNVVLASLNTENIISYLNNWFLVKTLQLSFKLFILSAAGHGGISWLKEDPKMPQDKCCFLPWHTQHWLPFPQGQADFVSLFLGDIYIYIAIWFLQQTRDHFFITVCWFNLFPSWEWYCNPKKWIMWSANSVFHLSVFRET